MKWAKDFYTQQYQLLESAKAWNRFFPVDPPSHRKRRAKAVERHTGLGPKRVFVLGCGGGITIGAISLLGNTVVAVDIVEEAAENARRVATQLSNGEMCVVQGDFYEIELEGRFDVVCYFDGFGDGSDSDQRHLLHRITARLKPQGCALIDVYSPWLFAKECGEKYRESSVWGRIDFDPYRCRILNNIWPVGEESSQAITQKLRCYSPADFQLLLEGTGLTLQSTEPYESALEFDKRAPLEDAEIYLTKLVHEE